MASGSDKSSDIGLGHALESRESTPQSRFLLICGQRPLFAFHSGRIARIAILASFIRSLVCEFWGDETFNQYAATETAGIAAEHHICRQMHFFEDLVLVDIIDENNRPMPHGAYGAKLLITMLFSRTLPLIRYELKDSVITAARG